MKNPNNQRAENVREYFQDKIQCPTIYKTQDVGDIDAKCLLLKRGYKALWTRHQKKIWKSSMSQKTGKKQLKIQPEKATYIIKIRCFAKKDSVETV